MSYPPQALEILHHRSLNTPRAFERGLALAACVPEARHAYEADVCWVADEEAPPLLYTRHPKFMIDRLNRRSVERGCAEGRMWRLEDALAAARDQSVVLELKVGKGDRCAALAELARQAGEHDAPVLIDAFSLHLLEITRSFAPDARLSLHTGRYGFNRTAISAVGWPPFRSVPNTSLPIDVVSLRYYGGWKRMWPQIQAAQRAGLTPHMSRLLTPEELAEGARAPLAAIYADPEPYQAGIDALRTACAERLESKDTTADNVIKAP